MGINEMSFKKTGFLSYNILKTLVLCCARKSRQHINAKSIICFFSSNSKDRIFFAS